MPLIECCGLKKDWAGTVLFEKISFAIAPGQKLGLVGRNGSGKTSLLRILAGVDEDFSGRRTCGPEVKIALVPQSFEVPEGLTCSRLLAAPALALEAELRRAEAALDGSGQAGLGSRLAMYSGLRSRYEALGGEEALDKAARVLARLGLAGAEERKAALLSGGEKNVLALAAALMGDPDLLLLDEPGNHLDFAGLAWLEDFLRAERRAILVVSHNRWLLDRAVDGILELEGGRLEAYAGGFSAYRLEKLRKAAGQGRDWQAGRQRIERLEALVRRFAEIAASRPDPAWGKRLRAKRSQLERARAQAADKPFLSSSRMSLSFSGAASKADFALIVRGYDKRYGERVLFDQAELDLLAGERVVLVGPNGSGKTSLLRDIVAAAGSRDGGPIRVGSSMVLGYCAQEQELFRPERSVEEEFAALGARRDETFKLLRRFLFDYDVLDKRIASLSGGERNRLQIARAVFLKANFLVLDEPTNHLDIEGRESVEEGLADFEGAILAVSHDRWFIEKLAERIVLVEDRRLTTYEGSFSEFWRDIGASRARASAGAQSRAADLSRDRSRAGARIKAGEAALRGGDRRIPSIGVGELEARIARLEGEKEAAEKASASAFEKRDFSAAGRKAAEATRLARLLDRLYAEWEAVQG